MSLHSDAERAPRQPLVQLVEARVHGRYLVQLPSAPPPWPVVVGFHGYGEDAADHLRELASIPGTEAWLLVSVQALHPFYTRGDDRIVASWMTRQDREHAIADNIGYVGRVLGDIRRRHATCPPLVFTGFSQGGAMAYRAASQHSAQGLIVLAADVPPDVAAGTVAPLPPVLIGRGSRDPWYTAAKEEADRRALERLGVEPAVCVFDGAHEWSGEFRGEAGRMLEEVRGGN